MIPENPIWKLARETMEKISAQREEILTAFIAKYGCEPNEVEQVTEFRCDSTVWFVRKKGQ